MKIKLIYKDSENSYIVRYSEGSFKRTKFDEAKRESKESGIEIGESEFRESQEIKLDWSDGTPPPLTKEEYQKEYWKKNKEKMQAYQKARYQRMKLDKTLVSE